jgi:ABC-type nitrate/sulfonate/bicarbonate transport system ATPase subunit
VNHDIDESAYLGERVVVPVSVPTTVQEDLRIDLPRDRDRPRPGRGHGSWSCATRLRADPASQAGCNAEVA